MMEDRNVDLIRIIKSYGFMDQIKAKLAKYMSETCGCPIERYTEDVLLILLKSAAYDYIHNASEESVKKFAIKFIRNDYVSMDKHDEFGRLVLNLGNTQVREKIGDQWVYIDGFHDTEFSKKLDYDMDFEF